MWEKTIYDWVQVKAPGSIIAAIITAVGEQSPMPWPAEHVQCLVTDRGGRKHKSGCYNSTLYDVWTNLITSFDQVILFTLT